MSDFVLSKWRYGEDDSLWALTILSVSLSSFTTTLGASPQTQTFHSLAGLSTLQTICCDIAANDF